MAFYNTWPQNPISVVIMIIISFLMLQAHSVKSASFTFTSFGPNNTNSITFQGDAFASNGALYLSKVVNGAPVAYSVGRASYSAPLRLWNSKTGKLASFTSTFSFIVAPYYNPGQLFGDGVAFFIAPFQSNIPNNSSGGLLGLFSADTALNYYKNQIVAVEFDSFSGNQWDPHGTHIGIDVNSIASVTTMKWQPGNAANAFLASATVSYESLTKLLSVSVKYPGSRVNGTSSSLSLVIDLRTVLPEWVRIGFSGATGRLVETHRILDWTFYSSF